MDVYALAKHGLTEEESYFIIAGGDHDELAQLHEILVRRLAEVDLPDGQPVGVMVEGSPDVSAWTIECVHEPGIGPQCDVISAGDVPSLLLSATAWEAGYIEHARQPPRLWVTTTRGQGYRLRPTERGDLERHYC